MFFRSCKILDNFEICDGYFLLKIIVPNFGYCVLPGQFLKIRISERTDIFFKRPFAIFDFENNIFSILYHIVGKGTKRLSYYKKDDVIDVLYPLGNGYPYKYVSDFDNVFILAGGIGFASVYYLVKEINKNKNFKRKKIFVVLGFKSRKEIFCLQFLSSLKNINSDIEFIISTDDGTFGEKGNLIDVFNKKSRHLDNILLFACGSSKMLEVLSQEISLIEKNIECYVSFETVMGCGIGICNGCTIKVGKGNSYLFKKICKDGPIFNIRDILWK